MKKKTFRGQKKELKEEIIAWIEEELRAYEFAEAIIELLTEEE